MTLTILFAAAAERWAAYEAPLTEALAEAGLAHARLVTAADPADVDYIVYAPSSDVQDFRPYTRLKAVLNLWAGVEDVVGNETLTVPLARMVDPGLTEGMVEWCVGHVLRHHLGMDVHIHGQDGLWRNEVAPPLARDRQVTVLGLGELGGAVATALAALNFSVTGWSRREKAVPGVRCLHGALSWEFARLAARLLRPRGPGHTLEPAALVNEAYLRLVDREQVDYDGASHFRAVAANAIRWALADHDKGKLRHKRRAPGARLPMSQVSVVVDGRTREHVDLHEKLEQLAVKDPRAARIVEMKFFGGLTNKEIADSLALSERSVEREWQVARAWLEAKLK